MLCDTENFMKIWPRKTQQDFKMPPNIELHRHPHCPNSCKIFCQTSSVLTCRNCTVFQIIYPNLWKCLVRSSGLFIFLTQTIIWSYSVAVHSQLYLAWIQDKSLHTYTHTHTHTHILLSNILTVFFSSSAIQPADRSVQVLVLQMTCQTHFGSKLAASLSAATYSSSSRFSCTMFWSASVTKDCQQSRSSFELLWKEWSPYSTASSSSRTYIFYLYMAHTAVSPTVVYCLQSKLPTHQSANITLHCTQNEKTVTIQLCQYQYS